MVSFNADAQFEEGRSPLEILEPMVAKWNLAISSHQPNQLVGYYADSLIYYGTKKSKEEAVKSKEKALSQAPEFRQSYSNPIARIVPRGIEVNFRKVTKDKTGEKSYPAFLVFETPSLLILEESDWKTEEVLAQKAKAVALREGNHCFELQGQVWTLDSEPALYATLYELNIKKGVVKGSGEIYDWTMRQSNTLEIKGKVEADQTLKLEIKSMGPSYPDNPDDMKEWVETRKFTGSRLLNCGGSLGEMRLEKVPCSN